jgi:4-amino-4-deoxy-L-arabinose transferase-like glycosyltransferase
MTSNPEDRSVAGRILGIAAVAVLALLAFYRLRDFPTPWFDEGIHLHVPETLLRYGVYADHSSDGFRYFGPTLGVGPTVMLPLAGMFKLLGIGLVQARVLMALYLLGALFVFYRFARSLHGAAFATLALLLLATSPSVAIFETGRQVLGEVPGLLLLVAGLWVWFSAWEGSWLRLTVAGLLFGLAAITKYQNLVVLAPTIALAALCNLAYYRLARFRVFLWPGLVMAAVFGLWQAVLVVYLGPQTSAENLATLREATAGAAAVFSPDAMRRAAHELLSFGAYGCAWLVALPYGLFCSLPRARRNQQWGILLTLVLVNFVWYVFASIAWPRYAFVGFAMTSLFVAKFFADSWNVLFVSDGRSDLHDPRSLETYGPRDFIGAGVQQASFRAALAVWIAAIVIPALGTTVRPIVRPPQNAPVEMAAYLQREIPTGSVIETWEPELGALTEHNYHYPPARLLNVAVRHIWLNGPSPSLQYHPLETDRPQYVVVGAFGQWVDVYPRAVLARDYSLVKRVGAYELYRRNDDAMRASAAP